MRGQSRGIGVGARRERRTDCFEDVVDRHGCRGGGGGLTMKEPAEGEAQKEQSDYCRFIPMGTELVAQFQQRTFQAHIMQNSHPQDNVQYASLMKVARSYDSRSNRAKSQAVGWGVSSTCYGLMMAKGGVELNPAKGWKNYLKLGASAFMTFYYSKLIGVHGKRAEAIRNLAKSLPGRGDCNPITDRDCYCTEPTTKYDPKYCHPSALGKGLPRQLKGTRREACIDGDAQADPTCECIAKDDCLDKGIDIVFSGADIPGAQASEFSRDLKGLTRGTLNTGDISNIAKAKKRAARAVSFLKENASDVPDDRPLSARERKQFITLKSMGLPAKIARGLALYKPSSLENAQAKKFTSSLTSVPSKKMAAAAQNSMGVVEDYGKSRSKNKKRRRRSKTKEADPFAKFFGKNKRKAPSSGRILSFVEQATDAASIHRKPETSLFTIISQRYRAIMPRIVGKPSS